MIKSISVWALKDNETRTAQSLFEEARSHGFDGVEVAVGLKGLLTPDSTQQDCEALVGAARDAGVQIVSVASGLGWQFPLCAEDPELRRKGEEILECSIRITGWLGVKPLLVVPGTLAEPGGDRYAHVPYDVAMERMRESVARLVPVAEDCGVIMGIENVWNRVLLSPLEMRQFVESFSSPAVGCYVDVGNMIAFGYAEDWIRILGRRICAVHFKDYKREARGTMAGFCDLLEGDVNWPAVMAALREVGYDGPCTAEFFQLDSEGLGRVSRAMDRILAM